LRRSGLLLPSQRLRYRGLHVGARVNLEIAGSLRFGKGCVIGEGSNIRVPSGAELVLGEASYVGRHVELSPLGRIVIGADASIQDRSVLIGDVEVGNHCAIAPNVFVSSGRHYFNLRPSWLIRDQDRLAAQDAKLAAAHSQPVHIHDDCWLGVNCVILPGVRVGRGAVVGANSVVVRDVDPYTVVAGTPARQVGKRLDFVPPRRISAASEQDRPYFYAGFELTQAAIEAHRERGGILARDGFVLRLDTQDARSLHVVACVADGGTAALHIGPSSLTVGKDFRELAFDCSDAGTVGIRGRIDPADARLLIKEVWVA
jgi:acetyltransferase-like isoleucine patch superfamily enzyme